MAILFWPNQFAVRAKPDPQTIPPTSDWNHFYERGRVLSWLLAIRFTFTKITISRTKGTRYAIPQPIIPIPDIIIVNLLSYLCCNESVHFLTGIALLSTVNRRKTNGWMDERNDLPAAQQFCKSNQG